MSEYEDMERMANDLLAPDIAGSRSQVNRVV